MSELVHVATVVRSRGNRGEVAVVCPGGHPERWVGLESTLCGADVVTAVRRTIRRAWLHGERLVVHFADVDSIDAAMELVGSRLYLTEEELPTLPPDSWYTFELVGAEVIDMEGGEVGRVVDTISGTGQDRMVVDTPAGRRVEIPMVRAILQQVDLDRRTIRIDPPPGLVEGEFEEAVPCTANAAGKGG